MRWLCRETDMGKGMMNAEASEVVWLFRSVARQVADEALQGEREAGDHQGDDQAPGDTWRIMPRTTTTSFNPRSRVGSDSHHDGAR